MKMRVKITTEEETKFITKVRLNLPETHSTHHTKVPQPLQTSKLTEDKDLAVPKNSTTN